MSSLPNSLPVFRLSKCILVQAGHMIPTYSFSEISGSSSVWCWTLSPLAGHLKTKGAISQDMTAQALDHDLEQFHLDPPSLSRRDSPVRWRRSAGNGGVSIRNGACNLAEYFV